MGCSQSAKQQQAELALNEGANEHGFKNLFHSITEFDLSSDESDNEAETIPSIKPEDSQKPASDTGVNTISREELPSTNNTPSTSTTNGTLLDNRLVETCI